MKQVIVANTDLQMSPGKLAAMVGHGVAAYFTQWLKENVNSRISYVDKETGNFSHPIKDHADFDAEVFNEWVNGSFTKIILGASQHEMEMVVMNAMDHGFSNGKDFFNIVDESTEFENIPRWAVIAFAPMDAERIDPITGHLNLYGYENTSLVQNNK